MKRFIFLSFLTLFACFSFAQESLDLYLLIGQSNMAGRGVIESQDTVSFKNVLALTKDLKWRPAQDPIHFDKKIAGVGLGRSFGIEMQRINPNATIGLIPCAVGGSPIDSWSPGVLFKDTNTYPWDDMVKRLEFALKYGELKGILWHQGESDTNLELAPHYGQKFKQLVSRLRTLSGNPEVPIVAGEMVRQFQSYNGIKFKDEVVYPKMVMTAIKIISKKDEYIELVSSKGLSDKGDEIHFNSESYRELGKRYAKSMQKLLKK